MTTTTRLRVRFTVKEPPDGWWVAVDPLDPDDAILTNGVIALELGSTDGRQAHAVATYLNTNVAAICYTK
jgi:hypothetical protein